MSNMAIQDLLTGTVANIANVAGRIGEVAQGSIERAAAIQTAKQQQMERVRSFKAKYKDFGGKEGYMNALSTYKNEKKGKIEAFKLSDGSIFAKGSKMYDRLVSMGEKPNASVKKGEIK